MDMDKFPGTLNRVRPYGRIVLTPEQEEWLKAWYPTIENVRLMKVSGMSHSTLHRYARQLHIVKSEKGLKGIMQRQAKRAKRINEENGWYDSLRGRAPSPQCQAGYQEYIHSDRYKHPMTLMKEQHPKKYKQLLEKRSKHRKELIRKEKLRIMRGLPQKTKLTTPLVMCRYTRSQIWRRYNALRRGYFLSTDKSEAGGERYLIFYDDDTRRAKQFEKNCIADGFTFVYEPKETEQHETI